MRLACLMRRPTSWWVLHVQVVQRARQRLGRAAHCPLPCSCPVPPALCPPHPPGLPAVPRLPHHPGQVGQGLHPQDQGPRGSGRRACCRTELRLQRQAEASADNLPPAGHSGAASLPMELATTASKLARLVSRCADVLQSSQSRMPNRAAHACASWHAFHSLPPVDPGIRNGCTSCC